MKKILILISVIISTIYCQNTNYGDAFLNIGASSRSIGLGRAVVALPQHSGGYLVNPAASGFISNKTLYGMYINQFSFAEYVAMGYTQPTKSGFQWGVHGVSLFVDDIFERPDLQAITDLETRRDMMQELVGDGFNTFNTRESALVFNLSKNIEKTLDLGWRLPAIPVQIPIGVNVKLLQKDLYKSKGTGIGVDLGGMILTDLGTVFSFDWLDYISLGLSINNIVATRIYWDTDHNEDIPMQVIVGTGYYQDFDRLPLRISLFMQQNFLYKNDLQYGVEVTLFDLVSIRGGTNYGELQGGIGISLGSKISKFSMGLDYSFSNHDLGNAHRIGGTFYF